MCGITGIIEHKENLTLLRKMCDSIAHRGPDGQSAYQHGPFAMGHLRLAVIDLKTGDQPIFNEDKSLSITFNGEIYNFPELKDELIKKGHKFYTTTDTEVILHLFEEEGIKAFSRLNGYFAFALCDHLKNELYLVRDYFGIKPLHYYVDHEKILYGSEIKSILTDHRILRELNHNALHQQLNLRFNQSLETMFQNIHRLKPAHYIKINENLNYEIKPYYELTYKIDDTRSIPDTCELIREKLKNAVKRQMISDVPLGLYLSGGIDSGSLVAMASSLSNDPIKTFTLGFNEPTDEFEEALLVAKKFGTEHHELTVSPDPLKDMESVIWHAEEPKINLIQGFTMSQFLRKHVTVALSGLGGDELFSGYDIYSFLNPVKAFHKLLPKFIPLTIGRSLSKAVYHAQTKIAGIKYDELRRGLELGFHLGDIKTFYLILRNAWDHNKADLKRIYHPDFAQKISVTVEDEFSKIDLRNHKRPFDAFQFLEFNSKMINDYLLTEDRMSMANSLEQRVPFLDKDLVEFAFTISPELKYKNGVTKWILREAMKDILPEKNLNKAKWGFTFNPYLQFQKDLKSKAELILTEKTIRTDKLFNYQFIRQILDHPPHPRLRWHYNYIWLLMGFYIWKNKFNVSI
jgi:asparagine synthase (glutamine-hydrolysing)